MSERAPSFEPRKELTGRERLIAAMGIVAFNFELGPNAHTPEADEPSIEVATELPVTAEE